MSTRLQKRSNEEWLAALQGRGEHSQGLVEELGEYVHRVLARTLQSRKLASEEVGELAQEAMLQILQSLESFRGDSAVPTWAAAVATRVAFTELRRRAARDAGHEAYAQAHSDALQQGDLGHVPPAEAADTRQRVFGALHRAIDTELSERQRIATLALLRGVPTIEIADQLASNQNAVYKLVHDARLRLREVLELEGITTELIDEAVEGGAQ